MVTSHMHISDTWLICRHRQEPEDGWEAPHLTNGNTYELLCSEHLLHTSLVVPYFFTFTVFACERNPRIETEKNPLLKWHSCIEMYLQNNPPTIIPQLSWFPDGEKKLSLRVTTAYVIPSATVRPSHFLPKQRNCTSLGLVQDLG